MGRAADFFTPVLQSSCRVVAVVPLSAKRTGSMHIAAAWPAKATAAVGAVRRCTSALATKSPIAVYLPISQWGLPLLRDSLIVVLARIFNCSTVLHLHGSQLPARLASSWALRKTLERSHWLVLSETVAAAVDAAGCRAASVHVIRNPAPPGGTPREVAQASSRTGQPLRIGWIGTMHSQKGFDILCDAVARLKHAGAPVSFTVAGFRSDVPTSRMACVDQDLGVLEPADVLSFWSRIDVFVLPARWAEGLPFVLLEGLQAGCAVAATWSAGSAELFSRGCVERIGSDVDSVTAFLRVCMTDIDGVRQRQQKLWRELRPLYDPDRVEASFAEFWQEADL
ncbi:glycosyltransferase family 4 protein [Streptomyces sp. NPDC019396]|uniref:glycosyltransferase family 4 protein n=1 Tax=Streptomyces sp. NPDC019396 TaxID=3154687 RepID=UPI0033C1C46E